MRPAAATGSGNADLAQLTVPQLLGLHGSVMDELRRREIVRSSNNPASDYAELLFCRAFGWRREGNSASGHDAVDSEGRRYQIKARRLTAQNTSRQLSALRRLPDRPFDALAGILFDSGYSVLKAAIIPVELVIERSARVEHTNSWKFLLRDEIWTVAGVRDVTPTLRTAASSLTENFTTP